MLLYRGKQKKGKRIHMDARFVYWGPHVIGKKILTDGGNLSFNTIRDICRYIRREVRSVYIIER